MHPNAPKVYIRFDSYAGIMANAAYSLFLIQHPTHSPNSPTKKLTLLSRKRTERITFLFRRHHTTIHQCRRPFSKHALYIQGFSMNLVPPQDTRLVTKKAPHYGFYTYYAPVASSFAHSDFSNQRSESSDLSCEG